MKKIEDIYRLYYTNKGENYMFDGCMRSVMAALGEPKYDFTFFGALTGDFFTQMYDPTRAIDSYTTDFFSEEIARFAFAPCGYSHELITGAQIEADPGAAMRKLIDSIDRGIPVIAKGIGDEQAFSLIGGYDDGALYANIWANQSADPYARYENLNGVEALIIAGEKMGEPSLGEVYSAMIDSVPKFLTRAPRGVCTFGRQALEAWCEYLLDDANFDAPDAELIAAREVRHDAPLIMLTTNAAGLRGIFARINADHPELGIVRVLAPEYAAITALTAELLRAQDGLFVEPQKLRLRELRQKTAGTLRQIGDSLADVYAIFCE